jgi:ankyrin repeat protein
VLIKLIETVFGWFPDESTDLKSALLGRLIHTFKSSEILDRYVSIVAFISRLVERLFFEPWEIANRLHDVLLANGPSAIARDFFFWFAPQFSRGFANSLQRFVEIEELRRVLPARYQELWVSMDEKVLNRNQLYAQMRTAEDPIHKLLKCDNAVGLWETIGKNPNAKVSAGPFDSDWFLFENPTILQAAAYFGAVECAKFLIKRRAKLNCVDGNGHNLFDFAVAGGSIDMVSFLMSTPCEIENSVKTAVLFHRNQLIPLLCRRKLDFRKLLTDCVVSNNLGFLVKILNKQLLTGDLLRLSIEHESLGISSFLIENPQVNLVSEFSLHLAAETHQHILAEMLLKSGRIDPNLPRDRLTAIQAAVNCCDSVLVRELLKFDEIDIDVRDSSGRSILHSAVLNCDLWSVECILRSPRMDVNCRDVDEATPLHLAVRNVNTMGTHIVIDGQVAKEELLDDHKYTLNYQRLIHTAIFRALISRRCVRMDVWDRFGRAPMHYAAQYGRFDFFNVTKAVRGEIDLDIRTQPQQMTCLQIAAQHGRSLLIINLKDPKLDKNSIDVTNRTALHYACVMGHAEVISVLLNDSKVNLNTCDVLLAFTKSLFATLGFFSA